MKHFVIGTAGHIDHGKTTLIKALTGTDTDRLAEEKKRGITIELGFTYFDFPNGSRVGIVDVPGHEKFINNMTAGVVGMDMVLLVIAADEGIMPQTREHMDILHLLGVEKCLVVLTKIDMVEPDWLEMLEEEIKEELAETFLAQAPIIKVSSTTGVGLQELVLQIEQMLEHEVKERELHTIARLPIDRVFTIEGFGTVVTGTLVSGKLSKDEMLTVYPIGKSCRVRSIQIHGEEAEVCSVGQRAAINISNIKKQELRRGCVLAPPESMNPTSLLDVKLQMLQSSERILKNNARLHLFTGTDQVLCRVILLDKEELYPGESGYAQLRLENELAVRRKDKFVVRFYSPLETIGGGVILEPNPEKKKRFKADAIEELKKKEEGSTADVLEFHIKTFGETLVSIGELAKQTGQSMEEVQKDIEWLEKQQTVYTFSMKKDTYVWHRDSYEKAKEKILEGFKEYAKKYPYRYGIKKAEIYTTYFSKMKPALFDQIMDQMERDHILVRQDIWMSQSGWIISKDKCFEEVSECYKSALKDAKYDFVKITDIKCEDVSSEVQIDILNVLENEQQIVKITDDIYTLKEYIDTAIKRIQEHFEREKILTVIQTKELFDASRKNAKLLMEYMDKIKVTKKAGAETERVSY